LCVGDAGLCYDPISGDGIVKALRSGVFASYAIADWLRRGDARGLSRSRLMLRREFATYWGTLCEYYAQERRWPDRLFWRRRHGGLSTSGIATNDDRRATAEVSPLPSDPPELVR
jgi:flavin-dependent dehydrogenase